MKPGRAAEIKQRIVNSEYWLNGTKDNGRTISPLKCPVCGKKSAYVWTKEPHVFVCNKKNKCGAHTSVLEVFPDLKQDFETDFKPTQESPDLPAIEYLHSRGISAETLKGVNFRYKQNIRSTGRGGVMFKVAERVFNGRIFDPPAGTGKTHNIGSTRGKFWAHPAQADIDPKEPVYVVEAILDALSLVQMGVRAVSVLSSGQSPSVLDNAGFKNVMLAFDADSAGREALLKWDSHLKKKKGVQVTAIRPGRGDWNDFLKRYGSQAAEEFKKQYDSFLFNGSLALAESAQEYAEVFKEGKGYAPKLFEFEGAYFFAEVKSRKKSKKGAGSQFVEVKRMSNFTMTVPHFQVNETIQDLPEFRYHIKVLPRKGRALSFTAKASELSTPVSLTNLFLLRGKVLWEGTREPSLYLQRRVVEASAPVVRQLHIQGHDEKSDYCVFPHLAISPKGELILPNKEGFIKTGFMQNLRPKPPDKAIQPDFKFRDFRRVYKLLRKAWGRRAGVAVAWAFASWFVRDIKKHPLFDSFPFLSLWGDPQTGKSRFIRFLQAFQMVDDEGLPMRKLNTGKGELRKIAQQSGVFTALLEANAGDSRRLDIENILTWFNESTVQLRAKKTDDLQTTDIPFLSSLAFVQNREPFETVAQKSRVISLEFRKEQLTEETTAAFTELLSFSLPQLAGFYSYVMAHRAEIREQWPEETKKALEAFGSVQDARINQCHSFILAFHRILTKILRVQDDLTGYFVEIAQEKKRTCYHRHEDIADHFIEMMFALYDQVQVDSPENTDSLDGCINIDKEDDLLWFKLGGVERLLVHKGFPLRTQTKDLQKALVEHPAHEGNNIQHRFKLKPDVSGARSENHRAYKMRLSKV